MPHPIKATLTSLSLTLALGAALPQSSLAESCTSNGSITRMLAADAKAATDSSTMAIVGAAGGRLAGEGRAGAAGEGIGSGLTGSVD